MGSCSVAVQKLRGDICKKKLSWCVSYDFSVIDSKRGENEEQRGQGLST